MNGELEQDETKGRTEDISTPVSAKMVYPLRLLANCSFATIALLFLLSLFFPHYAMEGPTADPTGFQTLEVTDPTNYSLKQMEVPWFIRPVYGAKQILEEIPFLTPLWELVGWILPLFLAGLLMFLPFLFTGEDNRGKQRIARIIGVALLVVLVLAGLDSYGIVLIPGP